MKFISCIKDMKKILKLLVAIILAIVVIGGVMFLVDCSRGKSGKEPMFARYTGVLNDGGTTYYTGLGYQISGFNALTGDGIWAEIGPWIIELKEEEKVIIDDFKDDVPSSGDIVTDINSGDLISGDIVNENIPSGEIISGDSEISGDVSGDKIDVEVTSGDNKIVKDEEYYFNATIIGVNKNNLIVQALEDEAINNSSDMFSFSLNANNNESGTEYLIGQKVKIKYTGTIRETYPAQIDVIDIEIIE